MTSERRIYCSEELLNQLRAFENDPDEQQPGPDAVALFTAIADAGMAAELGPFYEYMVRILTEAEIIKPHDYSADVEVALAEFLSD